MSNAVRAWEEQVIIPTYEIGEPEKNPIFLEKRVYQGSSGAVYPHPVVERIADEKIDKTYQAVFIENEYLKIMILPSLGGRIHRAYDKVRQRDFVYYNQVIKPALVGLAGPWISGGIEFNWPQHHRPSTFQPIDHTIEEHEDGSITVWVNEVEKMFRTKGMAGFTLYPGKAYIEIKGRLFNRTPYPQTFLWWANPAVKVNDDYQSVFPPDVYAVFDHGKRDVSAFPIAKGVYYKVDYAPGTDISRYKNIPVPTSYMTIQSRYNFIGGYEHDTRAGLLHVANHHISPGKKQWTWGNGDFGLAWDRNLTDEDGPYIELMCGVFTDNQPDFAWIQPNEEKTFEQYFMPYAEVGMVKNATAEAAVGIEKSGNGLIVKVYATALYENASIELLLGEKTVAKWTDDLSPSQTFTQAVHNLEESANQQLCTIYVRNSEGKLLVAYEEEILPELDIPAAAVAAIDPSEITSIEELFLAGKHIEQYRHATYDPCQYYLEALRREPTDIRCNNAMGLWWMRKFQFQKALSYFEQAIATSTKRNPNPYDGEPYYNYGWCLFLLGNNDKAYDALYKSIWNDAWQHAGFLHLARIDMKRKDLTAALKHIDQSLVKNAHSHTALHLKAMVLRQLNRVPQALETIQHALEIDPFNYGCLLEQYFIYREAGSATAQLNKIKNLMRGEANNYIEYALDYAHAGEYQDAAAILQLLIDDQPACTMALYYQSWCFHNCGWLEEAAAALKLAAAASSDYVFPNKTEDLLVLQYAIAQQPSDYKAYYYLGNLWYAARQYDDAIFCWERSVALNNSFATVHRNLALAYHNVQHNENKAYAALQHAFQLNQEGARVLMELDQLRKKMNHDPAERLNLLREHEAVVLQRDDLYLEMVTLYNTIGAYARALDLIMNRKFHPWEGGEGKVVGQYLTSVVELAKDALQEARYADCLLLLDKTIQYPLNLGEGKLYGAQENDILYLRAAALTALGEELLGKQIYKEATEGISEPAPAIFYNDPQPDKIFYQGLAWKALGENERAANIFQKLVDFGNKHLQDEVKIDYFAVSLPDLLVFDQDLQQRNINHCLYMQGLGYLGLGQTELAEAVFTEVLSSDLNHPGARVHLRLLKLDQVLAPGSFHRSTNAAGR